MRVPQRQNAHLVVLAAQPAGAEAEFEPAA